MSKNIIKPLYPNIAYDDAFRTMESNCDDILIPFVNYFFNESYDENAVIIRLRNEQHTEANGEDVKKRITDSHFSITQNGKSKRYHIECESKPYDGSLLLRLFEYDSKIAKENSEVKTDTLVVNFPYTGVLLLRDSKNTPELAKVLINTPAGEISYKIPLIKESDFTLDEIFEKKLFLLIPFYLFKYERDFKAINASKDRLEGIAEIVKDIIEKLQTSLNNQQLSLNSYSVIMNLTHSVINKLTHKHDALQKKVGDIMGGKVLDMPDVMYYKKGKSEGLKEGRAERDKLKAENSSLLSEIDMLRKENEELRKAHNMQ